MARQPRYDLSPFQPKMPWDTRAALIRRTFSCSALMQADSHQAWVRAFDRDPEFLGRILRDILKSDQVQPGRPGPRPALDHEKAQPIVDGWLGRDPLTRPYTTLPFGEVFQLLAGGRSLRNVARLVDMPRMTVHRLMRGEIDPTSEMILKVGQAFDKAPAFFVEWRIGVITSAIVNNLQQMPERSVRAYEAIFWQQEQVHEAV